MSDSTITKEAIVIERTFDAPVDLIWQMWTQPEQFKNWYGPEGFTVPVAEMDVRVGGKHLFCMAAPDGSMKMWSTGEYTEIIPNERLVYTDSMADENGMWFRLLLWGCQRVIPRRPKLPYFWKTLVDVQKWL